MIGRFVDLLLFVAAVSFGGYLASTTSDPTTNELAARKNNLLSAFDASAITRIEIESATSKTTLRREAEDADVHNYLLGNDSDERADPAAVGAFLSALEFATWQRVMPSATRLEELGLVPPVLTLQVMAGPRTHRILFGDEVPQENGHVYASVSTQNGETVFGTVKKDLLSMLQAGKQAFLARALFPLARSDTQTLAFSVPGDASSDFALEADAVGFLLTRDDASALRANRGLVDVLFFQLARASLEATESALPASQMGQGGAGPVSPKDQAPQSRVLHVRQFGPSGLAAHVELGGPCPGEPQLTAARRLSPRPQDGCVAANILAALRVAPDDLVARSASPFNADEIDHIVVKAGARRLDLVRAGEGYRLVGRGHAVPREAGDEFVRVFADASFDLTKETPAEMQRVAEVSIKGHLPQTAMRMDGAGKEAVHEMTLHVYEHQERRFIERLDDGALLEVPPWYHWAFDGDDAWARERRLLRISPEAISEVRVRHPNGLTQTIQRTASGFALQDGSAADAQFSASLLDELARLEAARFPPPRPKPAGELLEVRFLAEGQTRTIWLGKRTRGGYLAWADFIDIPFVVTQNTRDLFQTPLFDRSPALIHPDQVQTLELIVDERHYRFRQQGGTLNPVGGIAQDDLREPLHRALLGLEIATTAEYHRTDAKKTPASLTLKGTRQSGGRLEDFEITWGPPTSEAGYPMIPAFLPGDPLVYFIPRERAEALLELL